MAVPTRVSLHEGCGGEMCQYMVPITFQSIYWKKSMNRIMSIVYHTFTHTVLKFELVKKYIC